ncbi:hypothetical protein LWI28_010398 [Acer negundo]|uniref:RNase H type-1 domain-containing protein n=1 Tax=Acer negundo TaxID=4023 RepID=A0AAD5I947_ACENE|nr:hypothetical protein LWI28_010398 [Acer negundo]
MHELVGVEMLSVFFDLGVVERSVEALFKEEFCKSIGSPVFCCCVDFMGSKECQSLQGGNFRLAKVEEWVPPSFDSLIFNVDDSTRGSPGQVGIGGVLRDHRGKVLCLFSAQVGLQDAVSTEIMALAKACDLCMNKHEVLGKNITLISDSKIAVSWVKGQGIGNLTHVQTI